MYCISDVESDIRQASKVANEGKERNKRDAHAKRVKEGEIEEEREGKKERVRGRETERERERESKS